MNALPSKYNLHDTYFIDTVVNVAFLAVCAFGIGKCSYNKIHREIIYDAKVTEVKQVNTSDDLNIPYSYPIISIDKHSDCLDTKSFFFKKEFKLPKSWRPT